MRQADFFAVSAEPPAPGMRLTDWRPEAWPVAPDWRPLTEPFFASAVARGLGSFIAQRLATGAIIYPPEPLRALALTPLAEVRVVIIGQDPYHGAGQAEGLAFSVAPGKKLPPSLRNIRKELARDPALEVPPSVADEGSLTSWARQGVLLLNSCLTVEDGRPASHSNQGWEVLTDQIIKAVLASGAPVVFMLWGAHAQRMGLQAGLHDAVGSCLVLQANHPSPLSALRPPQPFLGCGHFSLANAFLRGQGCRPIRW